MCNWEFERDSSTCNFMENVIFFKFLVLQFTSLRDAKSYSSG